jgi:hypothetical protein
MSNSDAAVERLARELVFSTEDKGEGMAALFEE